MKMNGGKKVESTKYKDIIARYNDTQLMHAETILEEEEAIIYSQKKAIKEERKKRLRGEKIE